MASNRHLGRIIVLQSLYEYEMRTKAGDENVDLDQIIARDILPYEKVLGDTEFVYSLAHHVKDHFVELDKALTPIAPEWPISEISPIDRNILRIGLYELTEKDSSVPPKVAINEAVELAKAFGAENSSKFINGVLATVVDQLQIEIPDGKFQNQSAAQKAETSVSGETGSDSKKSDAGQKDDVA